MSLIRNYDVSKDVNGSNRFLCVGKHIWAINTQKGQMEMFVFEHDNQRWYQIDLRSEDIPDFKRRNFSSSCFCSANNKIYMWQNNQEVMLSEFNPRTLQWRKVINLVPFETAGFLVANNKLYTFSKENELIVACLSTGQITTAQYPSRDSWFLGGKIVEVNGSIYSVLIYRNSTRTVLQYNERDKKFEEVVKTHRSPGWLIQHPATSSTIWTANNSIYNAVQCPYRRTLLIDCFDIASKQWSRVVQQKIPGIDLMHFQSIFGTEQEFHLFSSNNLGVRHIVIQRLPKLSDLMILAVVDQTKRSELRNVADYLPNGLRERFQQTVEWRRDDLDEYDEEDSD